MFRRLFDCHRSPIIRVHAEEVVFMVMNLQTLKFMFSKLTLLLCVLLGLFAFYEFLIEEIISKGYNWFDYAPNVVIQVFTTISFLLTKLKALIMLLTHLHL